LANLYNVKINTRSGAFLSASGFKEVDMSLKETGIGYD